MALSGQVNFLFGFSDLFCSLDNLIKDATFCTALRLTAIPSTSCNNFSMQGYENTTARRLLHVREGVKVHKKHPRLISIHMNILRECKHIHSESRKTKQVTMKANFIHTLSEESESVMKKKIIFSLEIRV